MSQRCRKRPVRALLLSLFVLAPWLLPGPVRADPVPAIQGFEGQRAGEQGIFGGLALRWIPSGEFEMGCSPGDSECDSSESPSHRVTISQGFWIAETEVTQAQFRAVMEQSPSWFGGDDRPVEQVSWDEAVSFCEKLTSGQRAAGRLPTEWAYRLPSEAEWEYAARAGTSASIYSGTLEILGRTNAPALDPLAWYGGNSGTDQPGGWDCSGWPEMQNPGQKRCGTHAVGQKQANAWGLRDTLGNVLEWTQDCWNGGYGGAPSDGSAWLSGECSLRVSRGGSWNISPRLLRVSKRHMIAAGLRYYNLGFRPVLARE